MHGITKLFLYDRVIDRKWILPLIILYFHPAAASVSEHIKQILAVFFDEYFQKKRENQLLLESVL